MNRGLVLFDRYPKLAALPWEPLVDRPTPVRLMAGLARARGLGELWIKRDDLTNPHYGGNKPRKLEFLIAGALADGAKGVVTTGGIGTNHGVATAIYARKYGLECHLVLFDQPLTDHCRKALRLMHRYGAILHWAGNYPMTALKTLAALTRSRLAADPALSLIYPGGSSPLGTIGFVEAGLEIAEQVARHELPEPRRIYCAVGSCGTCAGLMVGLKLAGLGTEVIGVQVAPGFVVNPGAVARLANKTVSMMRDVDPRVPLIRFSAGDVRIITDQYGGAYGRVTEQSERAVRDAREHEDLTLETTYTGKTLAGMLADLRANQAYPSLFWNTFNSADIHSEAESVSPEDLPQQFRRFLK